MMSVRVRAGVKLCARVCACASVYAISSPLPKNGCMLSVRVRVGVKLCARMCACVSSYAITSPLLSVCMVCMEVKKRD